MGYYFTKSTKNNIFYNEELNKIRSYLQSNGSLNCSDEKLDELYREFSDEKYCAGWMSISEETEYLLEEFADWLDKY